jgi:hypothetical protein
MRRLILAATFLSFLGACSHLVPLSEIDAAESKWRAKQIQNYDFELDVGSLSESTPCSTGTTINVEVRSGRAVKFGNCRVEAKMALQLGSVPQMFETIRANRAERPPELRVRFNPALGYPEEIYINSSRTRTDYSVRYSVTSFREIK